jgi:hypothetical protein
LRLISNSAIIVEAETVRKLGFVPRLGTCDPDLACKPFDIKILPASG